MNAILYKINVDIRNGISRNSGKLSADNEINVYVIYLKYINYCIFCQL